METESGTDLVVARTVTCTLLDPDAGKRALPGATWAPRLPVELTWHHDDPRSARIRLLLKPALAQWLPDAVVARGSWVVALDVLAAGLDAPAGTGDVMITPTYRRDLTEIIVQAGADRIGLRARRARLAEFVADSRGEQG